MFGTLLIWDESRKRTITTRFTQYNKAIWALGCPLPEDLKLFVKCDCILFYNFDLKHLFICLEFSELETLTVEQADALHTRVGQAYGGNMLLLQWSNLVILGPSSFPRRNDYNSSSQALTSSGHTKAKRKGKGQWGIATPSVPIASLHKQPNDLSLFPFHGREMITY